MRSFKIRNFYLLILKGRIKKDEMRGHVACKTEPRNAYIVVRKLLNKSPVERSRC
jgi:hypothetical protein